MRKTLPCSVIAYPRREARAAMGAGEGRRRPRCKDHRQPSRGL